MLISGCARPAQLSQYDLTYPDVIVTVEVRYQNIMGMLFYVNFRLCQASSALSI